MNRYSSVIAQILGLLLALVVIVELAFSERSLNVLAIYLAVVAFVLPIFNPIRGYGVLIFCGCYLEVLKFGAWWQNARYLDMITLNLPPITAVAGICVGCLLMVLNRKIILTKAQLMIWCGAIFAGCLLGAKVLLGGGGGEGGSSVGEAANASAYLMLVPTTVTLLKTKEQCFNLLSTSLKFALPAALYAIYQAIAGYPGWHYDFMEAYRGWAYDINAYIQPVGTMNSPISLGTTCALCFCFVIVRSKMKEKAHFVDWLLALIFAAASILSGRRSSVLLMAVFLLGIFFFKTPWRAVLLYIGSGLAVLSLYVFASPLIYAVDSLNKEAERTFGRGTFVSRVANVGTFNERLLGFKNMTENPDLWSFFGSEVSEKMGKFGHQGEDAAALKREGNYEMLGDDFVHDGLNRAIISYGIVPIFVAGIIAAVCLLKMHTVQFSIRSAEYRRLIKVSVALILGVGSVTLTSQQALTIQPINLFVFMWAGIFIVIMRCAVEEQNMLFVEEDSREEKE